jgi:hypothetical protein
MNPTFSETLFSSPTHQILTPPNKFRFADMIVFMSATSHPVDMMDEDAWDSDEKFISGNRPNKDPQKPE